MAESKTIGGRFEIGEMLGQGGMATVYLGREFTTNQQVAIKLLKPETIKADPDIVARFDREGEALRRLNHPNIVKVLATVEEDDHHYVVMEYVDGGDLRELLEQHSQRDKMLPIARILEIALDLADALTRAHRLKIIHRDIKPANVLLAEDGTPRLTDFGVAHFGDSTRMTQTGSVIGTLAYLSPESCAGLDLDPRADIWAFGVMLYEMLTLQRPFDADNTAAMLNAILTETPQSLAELRPDTPPALVTLVENMLVKDRDQRIDSVRLVGAQLEAIIHGKDVPTHTTPTPPTTKGRPITDTSAATMRIGAPGKDRFTVGLIGIAAIALVLILAAVLLFDLGGSGDADEADIALVDPVAIGESMVLVAQMEHVGGEERDVSRFIVRDLTAIFEEDVPFSNIRIREYPGVVTSVERAAEVAETNGATLILWGDYDDERVHVEVQLGTLRDFPDTSLTREQFEQLINVRVQMTNERQESLAASVVAGINALQSSGADAVSVAQNVAILELVEFPNAEVLGQSVAAHFHRFIGAYARDQDVALEEITAAISLDAGHPILYLGRSLIYQQLGRMDDAVQDIRTAMRLGPEGWGMPIVGLAQHEMYIEGDSDSALERLNALVETYPDEWWIWTMMGLEHFRLGALDRARTELDRAIELGPTANFPFVGAVALALRDGDIARFQELMHIVQTQFPDPTFGSRLMQMAYGLRSSDSYYLGEIESFGYMVLRQWNEVIRVTELSLALEGALPDLYMMQGFAYCNVQDYESAEASYTRLIEAIPDYTLAYVLRAEVRQKQGNTVGALADGAVVLQSPLGEQFIALMPAFQSGEINCENIFDVDLAALMTEATESP